MKFSLYAKISFYEKKMSTPSYANIINKSFQYKITQPNYPKRLSMAPPSTRISHWRQSRNWKIAFFVCSVLMARCHTFYSPFQVFDVGIWFTPFLCILQLFLHSRGKHRVDYYGRDFVGHSSFSINLFPLHWFTFSKWVDYNILTDLTLSSSRNWFFVFKIRKVLSNYFFTCCDV